MKAFKSFISATAACIGAFTLTQCGINDKELTLEVCQWYGDAEAAISYTFDDNCPNQFSTIVPMMDEYDIKGTFFPVINWLNGNYNNIKAAAANGHEIGSHTISHPNLGELSTDEVIKELHGSRSTIEEVIGNGYKCVTIAFPYCIAPDSIELVSDDFINARVCDGKVDTANVNLLRVSSHPLGSAFNRTSFESILPILEKTRVKNGWSTLLFHEIDEGPGYSPFPSTEIRKSLEYLKENESNFWVATMGNVARYIVERDNATLNLRKENNKYTAILSLENYDEEIYNIPVTFKYTKKDGSLAYVNLIPNVPTEIEY
ncbi:MAG: polysaccharide deacetylase family protein [Bacteroidia bacterium]|nr:polysaccharide deacetylase family protein [Bacteroidia bacterium]